MLQPLRALGVLGVFGENWGPLGTAIPAGARWGPLGAAGGHWEALGGCWEAAGGR